ncbi:MAG TPA: hypothetical protein VMF35_00475 [Acidimicrobiales bacterium]|nr:hypothetical protein [Acidimicrobiales bacterium]
MLLLVALLVPLVTAWSVLGTSGAAWSKASDAASRTSGASPLSPSTSGSSGSTTSTPSSGATTAAATLTFVATSPVLVQTGPSTWQTTVLLTMSGTCPTTLSFWVVLPSGPETGDGNVVSLPHSCTDSNWQVLSTTLTFTALPGSFAGATLVVSQNPPQTNTTAAVGTATIQLSVQQQLPAISSVPLALVALCAVLYAALFVFAVRRQAQTLEWKMKPGYVLLDKSPVFASSSWTFKDSWATNITAVGALLATFLSASGSITTLFPGVPLYRFTIANAACGAIVAIVPLVVAVLSFKLQQDHKLQVPNNEVVAASFGAVMWGAAFTMFAVGAELSIFGVLAWVSSAQIGYRVFFAAALFAGAMLVVRYAVTTTVRLRTTSDLAAATISAATAKKVAATGRAPLRAAIAGEFLSDADAGLGEDLDEPVAVSSGLARSADTSLTL